MLEGDKTGDVIYTLEATCSQWISWKLTKQAKEELRNTWRLCKSWDGTGARDLTWSCNLAGGEVAVEMGERRSLRWWCCRRYPASPSSPSAIISSITTRWILAWVPQWEKVQRIFAWSKEWGGHVKHILIAAAVGEAELLWPLGWGSNSQGLSVCK